MWSMASSDLVTAEPGTPRLLRHVPALDGIRGVAILLVMATHAVLAFSPHQFNRIVPGGFLGVDLFFVLSGFLITSLLLGEQTTTGRISIRGFYRRRALRLLPALGALLVVHLVYTAVTGLPTAIEIRSIIAIVLYVSNWYVTTGHRLAPGLAHMWSLSVEEQFYLLWPIITVAVLGARRSLRFTVTVLVTTVVALAVWRAWLWNNGANPSARIGLRTDTRGDGLLLGALVGYLWTRRVTPTRGLTTAAWVSAAFLLGCAAFVPANRGFYPKGGYTLAAIAAATIVLAVAEGQWIAIRPLSSPLLRSIGRVSYGLYLWHLPVFFAVRRYCEGWPVFLQIVFALAVTAAVTLASWFFVEVPFLRLKRHAVNSPAEL